MARNDVEIVALRMELGAALEALRIKAGYPSRYSMAEKSPLNAQKIGIVEKGASAYQVDTLLTYCRFLDIDLVGLLAGKVSLLGKEEKPEKKPVGRPATKVPYPLPDMTWAFFGIGDNPRWEKELVLADGQHYWQARETGEWLVDWFINNDTFDWWCINFDLTHPYVFYKKMKATSVEDAQKQIDKKRREREV